LAQEELVKAKQLIADSNNEAADRMLSRAQIDAELAIALAKEATAVAEAQQALAQIQKLKK
jgi:N-acetylmuramic acid 6-phosphate (MurNAc-6-P) etherase